MAALLIFPPLVQPARAQEAAVDVAQQPGDELEALRVFFDCRRGSRCDLDFYRTEIPYLNYTRDRADADVHVLVTSEETGAGGRLHNLDFIGLGDFEGIDDRLTLTTLPNMAAEQSLTDLAALLEMGLVRYLARTAHAQRIQVDYENGGEVPVAVVPGTDPWNFWTLRVNSNVEFDVDERRQSYGFGGGVSADRITEQLKLEASVRGEYDHRTFKTSDSTSVVSVSESWGVDALSVWSLSDHWSMGVSAEVSHSSFANRDVEAQVGPALEFNIFPYSESTRRRFNFLYAIRMRHTRYIKETVFLTMEETRPHHRLHAGLSVRQPWGESWGSLNFSQYLDDRAKNRFSVRVGANFRLTRGLSLNLNAGYARIRDQVNVPLGDATLEEVLLRQRVLQSGYEYGASVGFSYTFGSIYSSVVNPRLDRL